MLRIVTQPGAHAIIELAPAREAVVTWNSASAEGAIELSVVRSDGARSAWLPYATWGPDERSSHSSGDGVASIATDVVRASVDIASIEVRSDAHLESIAVSTPAKSADRAAVAPADWLIDVPQRSQYDPVHPAERGWCSPAAVSMLLAYWDIDLAVADVADRVYDRAYGGTGNWAFNLALAGALGLRGAVAHLRDLANAERFIAAGIPLALSISWRDGALPGAPLTESDGHIVVLCGFGAAGEAVVNDPAQPSVRTSYPRNALERAWTGHGGISYLIATPERAAAFEELANA